MEPLDTEPLRLRGPLSDSLDRSVPYPLHRSLYGPLYLSLHRSLWRWEREWRR